MILRPRYKRSLLRLLKAGWYRDIKRRKFIEKLLIKKGFPLAEHSCPSVAQNKVRCILKDFKRMGAGGVGLIWGCDSCRGGADAMEDLAKPEIIAGKMGTFTGQCRSGTGIGDANKVIIIPSYTDPAMPRWIKTSIELIETDQGLLERMVIRVLAKS